MKSFRFLGLLTVATLTCPTFADAHHSFPAQFDGRNRTTLTGPVTKVEWMNPHIYFYVDVTDAESGVVTNYAFEMGSPNTLVRLGWSRSSLQLGDIVTVEGALARDGSPLVNASSVILTSSGRKMFAGSSEND